MSQWDHYVKRREEIIYREIEEWDKKLVTFIKDVMKDVLISLTMSSSDNFFALKSLTSECVLSSNEIHYSLKSLINIEAVNYSFANWIFIFNQAQINKKIQWLLCKKAHYSCNLFESNCSRSYETFRLYADHLIRSTSNDSWKNMNEQNWDDYWYERWLSSIF